MDFLNELKKICREADRLGSKVKEKDDEYVGEQSSTRYNVWKTSLPKGINEIIVYNITEKEALWWIKTRLKSKEYEVAGSRTVILYEKFPVDTRPTEKNIYLNPKRFCTEDFPMFNNPRV